MVTDTENHPNTTLPSISVIIPAWNAENTLADQLAALRNQDLAQPWEVIVADNGSTDRTSEIARANSDGLCLRVVPAVAVRGPAHARNVGVRAARAELLAFVDADDVVAPNWLRVVARALDQHTAVVSRFEGAQLNTAALRETRGLPQQEGLSRHDYATFLPHAGASGLAVRRSVHDAIGGFDETLRYLEDTDYTWRLQLAGHTLHYEREAVVHVRFRTSTRGMLRQAFNYGRYNGWLYTRYLRNGMQRIPLQRHLRSLILQSAKLALRPRKGGVLRHLRSLANSLGIFVGRIESSVRGPR